jgi:hypothetical protein
MSPKPHPESTAQSARWRALVVAFLIACPMLHAGAAKTGKVNGVIFTIGSNRVRTLWPNAHVSLKNLETNRVISSVSDDLGAYAFIGVPVGKYEMTVTLAGFEPGVKRFTLGGGDLPPLGVQLVLKEHKETVTVRAQPPGVDLTSSSGGTPELTQDILKSVIRLNQDFQEALPLLPGVVRGFDGLMRIKGGRANQTNTLVNTASVLDPFTGQAALRIPAIAVRSVRVLSNPFSAEYGRFASGVVDVNTRGGTDEWKWLFEDPIPRFRWIDYQTHGVESASPHLTFAGPIKRGTLYLFQSVGYGYDTVRVPSLPNPDNVRVVETITSYTQLDWNPKPNHQFTAVLTADPQNTKFANIDTFDPQPVAANYHQRGFFASATYRWILANGGFVQSLFSAKRLDAHVLPASAAPGQMTLFPEQNSGTYFEDQDRRTRLYQWSQTFHVRPFEVAGRHLVAVGYSYARSMYSGAVTNSPVTVLREDQSLTSRITYEPTVTSDTAKNELALFAQDNWQIHPRLALDVGVRLDTDSLAAETADVAPRIGFVCAPTDDNRTAIRGGFGLFFDKIPINTALFPKFPAQTITRDASDGLVVIHGPTAFPHVIATSDGRLHVPYSLGWNLQFDRELRPNLLLRLGYEQREVYRELYVNPYEPSSSSAQLQLLNSGRQSYREFLALLRWRTGERTTLYASYARSKAKGELNDYNQFFGNFPYPLIRPNQFGTMSTDAPDRGLFWGVVGLPHKLDFIPILDVHTGFPFSKVDQDWNYLGLRNQAGRFPVFVSLDTKFQYPVDFTYRKHRIQFRAGLSILNVLNYVNPRDVQQYTLSPNYGRFYNSIGRLWRIDGDFDF